MTTTVERYGMGAKPPVRVSAVPVGWELARLAARAALFSSQLTTRLMYAVHAGFSKRVSADLSSRLGPGDVMVALPFAALEIFTVARAAGARTVLHFVNNHPDEHNRIMMQRAGLGRLHHEMVPERPARRVELEIRQADLIMVPSRAVANQLLARGVTEKRLLVAPYGVDTATFNPGPSNRSPRPTDDVVRVIFVGQISHLKGVPLLLAAMQHLGDGFSLDMYGPLVSREIVRALPENVRWHGTVGRERLAQLLRDGDVFVLPSHVDAFAFVVTEALASGLPVVTTTATGSSEFVVDGINGFVLREPDAKDLARALRSAANLRPYPGAAPVFPTWESYSANVLPVLEKL